MLTGLPQPRSPVRVLFESRVCDVMPERSSVHSVRIGTPYADVIKQMAEREGAAAIVIDSAGHPIGTLTAKDVARRIPVPVEPGSPVEAVMTAPLITVSQTDELYKAIVRMRRYGLDWLAVVDAAGRLAGMLRLDEALAAIAAPVLRHVDRFGVDEDGLDGARELKQAAISLVGELLDDHVPAVDVQQLLTRINNDVYCRVADAMMAAMTAEGWGDPPVPFALIVMGSSGRGENFLNSDQDNGLIVAGYPDTEHARFDRYYREFAERLCRSLHEVGIPYCNGYCMAVNPLWRKTLPQWAEQIHLWVRKSNPVAVRLADIFFDFHAAWGAEPLATDLRRIVTPLLRNNRPFLRQMFADKANHNVALNMFGGFQTERDDAEHRGEINLKLTAMIPLVGAVRLLALREGVESASTPDRLEELRGLGVVSRSEADDLYQAFSVVTDTLLRRQIADARAGRQVTYFVDPEQLRKRQRAELLDALKVIDAVRKRVSLEFSGRVF
jgi:signal-transduction protein with cAMP-binding, CBS, and nucleotidyltransferase domain